MTILGYITDADQPYCIFEYALQFPPDEVEQAVKTLAELKAKNEGVPPKRRPYTVHTERHYEYVGTRLPFYQDTPPCEGALWTMDIDTGFNWRIFLDDAGLEALKARYHILEEIGGLRVLDLSHENGGKRE